MTDDTFIYEYRPENPHDTAGVSLPDGWVTSFNIRNGIKRVNFNSKYLGKTLKKAYKTYIFFLTLNKKGF